MAAAIRVVAGSLASKEVETLTITSMVQLFAVRERLPVVFYTDRDTRRRVLNSWEKVALELSRH